MNRRGIGVLGVAAFVLAATPPSTAAPTMVRYYESHHGGVHTCAAVKYLDREVVVASVSMFYAQESKPRGLRYRAFTADGTGQYVARRGPNLPLRIWFPRPRVMKVAIEGAATLHRLPRRKFNTRCLG